MSTHKKPKKLRVAPSNAVAEIDALSESLGYAAALPIAQVKILRGRGATMPLDVIKLLAKLAEQRGGFVAGTAFDAAAARDALARSEDARAIANAARRLSRRAFSEAAQNLALVADRSMAVTQAMDRIVRTPEGKPFVEANDQVRSLMRAQSRPGRTRKAAKAKDTGTSTTAPNNGVVIAKPAVPSTSLPS
jgi:hypothetical protein